MRRVPGQDSRLAQILKISIAGFGIIFYNGGKVNKEQNGNQKTVGGLAASEEYRCNECDKVIYVQHGEEPPESCECGGTFMTGLKPRCPECSSREVEGHQVIAYLD